MSSDQSYVREGPSYDEVFPLGQDNPGTSYDERVPSSNSFSTEEDEDLDMDGTEGDSNDEVIGNARPPPNPS